jgi:hypothetical protein
VRDAQAAIGKLTVSLNIRMEKIFRSTSKQHAFLQPYIRVAVGASKGIAEAADIVRRLLVVLLVTTFWAD